MSNLVKKVFGKDGKPKEQESAQDKSEPMIPDIEALRLAARRRAARRSGGRASTIMSNRLGP